jgi:energy-coupling factor transport system permease protein
MDVGEGLGYRRLGSPLHATRAWIAAAWASALIGAALICSQPILLAALILGVLGAGMGAGVGRALLRTLRTVALVAIPIVVINLLVSRNGLTVFARLGDLGPFGQGDLTVEALVFAVWIVLKLAIVMLVTTLAGLAIDPDELMRIFRGFSFRSALTASLALRMVPLLSADGRRLAEAQRTRPDVQRGVRARALLIGAVVAGSLDRAMDVAATLEVRGFAARRNAPRSRDASVLARRRPGRPGRPRAPLSRHDLAFLASALAVAALAVAGALLGLDEFSAYPLVRAPVTPATLLLCGAMVAAILLPFCDRRGIEL